MIHGGLAPIYGGYEPSMWVMIISGHYCVATRRHNLKFEIRILNIMRHNSTKITDLEVFLPLLVHLCGFFLFDFGFSFSLSFLGVPHLQISPFSLHVCKEFHSHNVNCVLILFGVIFIDGRSFALFFLAFSLFFNLKTRQNSRITISWNHDTNRRGSMHYYSPPTLRTLNRFWSSSFSFGSRYTFGAARLNKPCAYRLPTQDLSALSNCILP